MRKCSEKRGFFGGNKFVSAYVERDKKIIKKKIFALTPPAHLIDFYPAQAYLGHKPPGAFQTGSATNRFGLPPRLPPCLLVEDKRGGATGKKSVGAEGPQPKIINHKYRRSGVF